MGRTRKNPALAVAALERQDVTHDEAALTKSVEREVAGKHDDHAHRTGVACRDEIDEILPDSSALAPKLRDIYLHMSVSTAPVSRMSPAEYLAWERAQPDKHQLLHGEVYAMAGGSPRHDRLCVRILARLDAALRGRPCGPFSSDQKIFIPASSNFVYPDGTVVCGPVKIHDGTSDVIDNPSVIVEVLSKSTEQHDRGDKWEDYRSIQSLQDYVLVSQRLARLEHFAREADGSWRYRVAGTGSRLELTIGTILVVDEIFEGAFDLPGDA